MYLSAKDLISLREVELLLAEVGRDERVTGNVRELRDLSGKKTRLAFWFELGNDMWSAVSTNPRIINNIRMLLGEEAAFFHGKVMLKEANSGGAWEWHQDFGYWYTNGFAYPRMMSAFIALDPATTANGCLQVLRGSHKLGLVPHQKITEQWSADPARMPLLEPLFGRVSVEMSPGSVLFFHANLLHTSSSNTSNYPRRSFIIAYNALHNPQLLEKMAASTPCPVSADDAILGFA